MAAKFLRDYQSNGSSQLVHDVRAGLDPLYVLPTGGGKTAVACATTEALLTSRLPVAFLVHRWELLKQASAAFLDWGLEHSLCSCDLISEGVDVPALKAGILLRATRSTANYMQQVGRLTRPAPGKTIATLIDMVGNIAYHGLPDATRMWSLESGLHDLERSVAKTRTCRRCYYVTEIDPSFHSCPACGVKYTVRQISLHEPLFGLGDAAPAGRAKGNRWSVQTLSPEELRAKPYHSLMARARSLADIQRIAEARGYRAGWVRHRAQEMGLVGGSLERQ